MTVDRDNVIIYKMYTLFLNYVLSSDGLVQGNESTSGAQVYSIDKS